VAKRSPGSEIQDRLKSSMELINEGAQSVRAICSGLRPHILDDLGLAAAIEWQAIEFQARTGITCEVKVSSSHLHPNSDQTTAFFRIFQECLTNVSRHAEASGVTVCLFEDGESQILEVRDNGKGFQESEAFSSLGILGMKERARDCGGEVQLKSAPGKGTTVSVSIPVGANEDLKRCTL
jgi:signal transduction histidine kinase